MFTSEPVSSLNSYGYSPHPLQNYIEWIFTLLTQPNSAGTQPTKPIIISITESSPTLLAEMLVQIQDLRQRLKRFYNKAKTSSLDPSGLVAVELNTSCPNIPDHPPPSYDPFTLAPFLAVLASSFQTDVTLTIGLKLPPYLYSAQFRGVLDAITKHSYEILTDAAPVPQRVNPITYLACTNTLGSSLLFHGQTKDFDQDPLSLALPTGFGGLAGEAIHPIAIGNVYAFAQMIPAYPDPALQDLKIIGIGGVTSPDAVSRMYKAGAHVVGSATLLGQLGVEAFALLSGQPLKP